MNKEHLRGKHIVFRLRDQAAVYSGTVMLFESDGFWVEAPVMISQLLLIWLTQQTPTGCD
jgi:hypothetical protein